MVFMSTRKGKKLSRDEAMDHRAISEAEDPAAWEAPVKVPPSTSPRPRSRNLELAAKFFVLSILHRLGAEANLTFAQPDNVDITVVQASGHVLTIDVKTLAGTTTWPIDKFRARKHHYIVFVCYSRSWRDPGVTPEVYLTPSQKLKALLTRTDADSVNLKSLAREVDPHETWHQIASVSAA